MERREFIKKCALTTAGAFVLSVRDGTADDAILSNETSKLKMNTHPNIILILADDMGYSDIGCYGGEIQTPNINKLAVNGLRFTQFYNGARCCPTRASLLTGLYAHQTGMGGMEPDWGLPGYRGNINNKCVTIAEALRPAGYSTYMAGKWHLTNKTPKSEEEKFNWPLQRGFDRYYGTISGSGNFFEPASLTRDNENIENEAKEDKDFYYTDAISSNAVKFIKEHKQSKPDKPFFLYVAYTSPHWPLHAKESDIQKYRQTYKVGWDVIRKQRHERMIEIGIVDKKWPLSPRDSRVPAWDSLAESKMPDEVSKAIKGPEQMPSLMAEKMAVYAAQVDCMDQGVGRIVNALKDTGNLENTLLVFLSDNGGCDEYGPYGFGWANFAKTGKIAGPKESNASYGPAWAHVSNTPFCYYKHFIHEGGISTPLIVHWPEKIKTGNKFCGEVGHLIDIMPTFLEAAGAKYPKEFKGEKIHPAEGLSLVSAFSGNRLPERPIFWEHHGNRGVRQGKWKLVAHNEKGPWELYDMKEDRTELNNLIEKESELAKKLEDMWWEWAKRCNVLPMNPNPKKKQEKANNE